MVRDTTDSREKVLDICIQNILLIYTPTNALNKIQFLKVLKLLYILALDCHHKGVTEQRNVSPTCLSRYYTACLKCLNCSNSKIHKKIYKYKDCNIVILKLYRVSHLLLNPAFL